MNRNPIKWNLVIPLDKLVCELSFWGWVTGVVVMGFSALFMYMSINGYMELRTELRQHLNSPIVAEHTHTSVLERTHTRVSEHTHARLSLKEHVHPFVEHKHDRRKRSSTKKKKNQR